MTEPRSIRRRLLLSAVLGLALPACSGGAAESRTAEAGVQPRELPTVRVATVEVREMARVLETTSKLESEREIEIQPRLSGVVLTLSAEEGDVVQEGAELAALDDASETLAVKDAEVALQEARNELDRLHLAQRETQARSDRVQVAFEQAVRDYDRNLKLYEGERIAVVAQSALEASQLARDNADADRREAALSGERAQLDVAAGETAVERAAITLERARLNLAHTRITAPFAGVVAQRSIKVGDSIGPGTTAFVLTDVDLMRCVFARPQEELGLFSRVGIENGEGRLALSATADAFPGQTFTGWIERVSPTIEAQSGQFRVTGRLECVKDNGRVRLLPGMLVRLRIVTERHPEALVVPKRALEREGDRRFLLAAEPDANTPTHATVRRVEVDEGFAEGDWLEVLPRAEQRLAAGDAVIVVGGRDVNEGDTVQVDAGRASASSGVPEAK